MPGVWPKGATTGHALVVNLSDFKNVHLEPGDPVAEVRSGYAEMCLCTKCGTTETLFFTGAVRGRATVRRSAAVRTKAVGCVKCQEQVAPVSLKKTKKKDVLRQRPATSKKSGVGLAP